MTPGAFRDSGFIQLKRLIPFKGMTQEKLAGKLGISKQALSNKLAGRCGWHLREIYIIARELNVPQTQILEYFPEELCK